MAIGDLAASKGLATYTSAQPSSKGFENDNQRGDELAALMGRTETVEAAVNQPIASIKRSTATSIVQAGTWALATTSLATTPELLDGFTWDNSSGQLTTTKAGIYRITGSVFYTVAADAAGIQITKNTLDAETGNTVTGFVTAGRGVTTTALVRLAAGDVLRLLVFQNSNGAREIAKNSYNLTFTAEWVRA